MGTTKTFADILEPHTKRNRSVWERGRLAPEESKFLLCEAEDFIRKHCKVSKKLNILRRKDVLTAPRPPLTLAPTLPSACGSQSPRASGKGGASAVRGLVKGRPRCLVKGAGAGRRGRSCRGDPAPRALSSCVPLACSRGTRPAPAPIPPNLFSSLDPRRFPAGLDAWTRRGQSPLPDRQGQGWDQRLPAPRSAPPACGQPGFPAGASAPASVLRSARFSLGPALPERGAPAPGCTGPGAASTGQRPPALCRQSGTPPHTPARGRAGQHRQRALDVPPREESEAATQHGPAGRRAGRPPLRGRQSAAGPFPSAPGRPGGASDAHSPTPPGDHLTHQERTPRLLSVSSHPTDTAHGSLY